MAKKTSSNRRERRKNYSKAGFLKIKNDYNPLGEVLKGWYKKTSEEGKLAHEAHTRMVQEQIEEAIQSALNKSKENWTNSGYNAEEMTMLEEAFLLRNVKNKATLTEDRKKAKRLEKEAYKLKQSRA
jgi:hypothetical protein